MSDRPRKMTAGRRDLARKLEKKGWSQQELSRRLGVEPAIVSRWMSGERVPELKGALELERVLGIAPKKWLVEIDDEPSATGTDGN